MKRKIPTIMGTQHPDNAGAPFFQDENQPFIVAAKESEEAYLNFSELDVDEYMWDWEGKNADSAVIDRLYSAYFNYFNDHPIGGDKFLTFRFPNIWEEKDYSLMQAMVTMLYAEDFAQDNHLPYRPLFEAILPMTQSADQLIEMQSKFAKLAEFKFTNFSHAHKESHDVMMIPLFEGFEQQLNSPDILREFMKKHEEKFGKKLPYIRVFLAGSDSALSNGFLNSIIGNKVTLYRIADFSEEMKIPIYPIAGMGSAIFRGGLSPQLVDRYLQEYPGVKTVTVQSGFRYDNALPEVKAAIARLRYGLERNELVSVHHEDQEELIAIATLAAENYHDVLDEVIQDLQPVFDAFPKRRDRHQHTGILGYSREVDGFKMPRAINFTGAFYSVGVPPEFLGTGKTLKSLTSAQVRLLNQYYPNMRDDFSLAGRYYSEEALNDLISRNSAWQAVKEDIEAIESFFGFKLGPRTEEEQAHAVLADDMVNLSDQQTKTALLERMGILRHFLG